MGTILQNLLFSLPGYKVVNKKINFQVMGSSSFHYLPSLNFSLQTYFLFTSSYTGLFSFLPNPQKWKIKSRTCLEERTWTWKKGDNTPEPCNKTFSFYTSGQWSLLLSVQKIRKRNTWCVGQRIANSEWTLPLLLQVSNGGPEPNKSRPRPLQ